MPRRARVVCPGYLHHITQRGNNRQYVFQEDDDYILYLKRIEEYRRKCGVEIYAYCLMGNHVHFIMKPYSKKSIAEMFRGVHMRYAQYYQKKTKSSGHVWQGRYYSCLLYGAHVQEAIRYVELNPVRAKMVKAAREYSWSSTRARLGKKYQWVTLADVSEVVEVSDWKAYLQEGEDDSLVKLIRKATKKNLVLGPKEFILKLENILKRKIMPNPKGRPRKRGRK